MCVLVYLIRPLPAPIPINFCHSSRLSAKSVQFHLHTLCLAISASLFPQCWFCLLELCKVANSVMEWHFTFCSRACSKQNIGLEQSLTFWSRCQHPLAHHFKMKKIIDLLNEFMFDNDRGLLRYWIRFLPFTIRTGRVPREH